jgi:hypothetical protein
MRQTLVCKVLLGLYLCGCALACAQYPDPPAIGWAKAATQFHVFQFKLMPGETAHIKVTFIGHATGCVLLLHAEKVDTPLGVAKHDLSKSPDAVALSATNSANSPVTYYLSGWTFLGGPPRAPTPTGNGYVSVPWVGAFPPRAPDPVHFVCPGSANGATDAYARITIE